MCGIAGDVTRNGSVDRAVVEAQLKHLLHRGPDSLGVHVAGRAAIGQTRLAVIDPEHGDPPVTDESGDIGVALNGEIYNHRELQDELRAAGHRLSSRVDTEVLAHLAEELEPVELARGLDGMFAFAIWDGRRQQLVLGRDRMGKKPLYYWHGSDRFVFASELKALLDHPAVPVRLDPQAIPAYLTFGYVPTPRTFYEEIVSLPPGHVLVVEDDLTVHVEPYWQLPVRLDGEPPVGRSPDEAATEVRAALGRAVERRLVSDVPLGAFLSGGIDSSAVVGLMSEMVAEPVRTFTIGFEDQHGFDERPYARMVADRFGTEHTEFVVRPDAVDLVERLVWHYDQPFGDSSSIPTFLLAECTRQHVTVALSGDGGDELFAGYERFAAALAAQRYQKLPASVRRSVRSLTGTLPSAALRGRVGSVQRFLRHADQPMPEAYLDWTAYVSSGWRERLTGSSSGWDLDDYRAIHGAYAGAEPLDRLLALNIRTYLLDDLLPKVDRMSMAHALEVRSPFLDQDLLELAFSLPGRQRLRGFSFKRVLKEAVRGLVPDEVLDRRKRGFGVPLDRWFREDLGRYLESTLLAADARVCAHLRGDAVRDLVAEHRAGNAEHGHALWTLLTLEVFLRKRGW